MWILGEVVQSRGSSLVGPHSLWTQQLGGSPRCNGRDKFKVKSVLLIGLNTGKCSNYLNLFLSSTCLGITYVTNFFGYLFNRWNLTRYLPAILIQRPGFSPSYRNRRKFPVIFQKCTIIVFVDSNEYKVWILNIQMKFRIHQYTQPGRIQSCAGFCFIAYSSLPNIVLNNHASNLYFKQCIVENSSILCW